MTSASGARSQRSLRVRPSTASRPKREERDPRKADQPIDRRRNRVERVEERRQARPREIEVGAHHDPRGRRDRGAGLLQLRDFRSAPHTAPSSPVGILHPGRAAEERNRERQPSNPVEIRRNAIAMVWSTRADHASGRRLDPLRLLRGHPRRAARRVRSRAGDGPPADGRRRRPAPPRPVSVRLRRQRDRDPPAPRRRAARPPRGPPALRVRGRRDPRDRPLVLDRSRERGGRDGLSPHRACSSARSR